MRIAAVRTALGSRTALVVGEFLYDVQTLLGQSRSLPDVTALLVGDEPLIRRLAPVHKEILAGAHRGAAISAEQTADLGPPVSRPEKILCAGLNYLDHVAELGVPVPVNPLVFAKLPSAISGPRDRIRLPAASGAVDYEVELAVVIGRAGRNIPLAEARRHVAGYLVCNDVSARDWQFDSEGQLTLGKGFDSFFPAGPWLTTADEIADPDALAIRTTVNDEVRQESRTSELVRGVDELVSWLSTVCTLTPGDIIATGTPAGVGASRMPPRYLQPGDVVRCEIEGLGAITNVVTTA
ncbi:fumarylacetoacetate hydrolase family protein [Kribbella sp. NPDC026611]|uniref:fumarylacetoacetate hydrolase family protein n=1 Tax=Kribbella sp. NPDC026611 TaxID=3154911 RepID=UPI0033F2303C